MSKRKRKIKIDNDFLESDIIGHCFLCNGGDQDFYKLRQYYKYAPSLTEASAFSKKSKIFNQDLRLHEQFTMCDGCRMYWDTSIKSTHSIGVYKKIYNQNYYKDPQKVQKLKESNAKAYQKRKENINE